MAYWAFKTSLMKDGAALSAVPSKGPKAYKYSECISLLADFPEQSDAVMCFDPNFPDRVKLYDIVDNIDDLPVVSTKVRALFEKLNIDNVEYLPITLWDHNDQVASTDYCICNVVGTLDVIDMDKSEYVMNRLIKDQIKRIKNLVLIEERVPENIHIFAATTKRDQLFISDELKAALEEADIKGWVALPAQGWDGMDF